MLQSILQCAIDEVDRIAVIDRGETHSYGSVQLSARVLARKLSRIGYSHGDRVAAFLPNSLHAVVACLAAARTGRSYLPLNIGLKHAELDRMFRQCNVRVVMCRASMRSQIPGGVEIVAVDEVLDGEKHEPSTDRGEWPGLAPERNFVCLSTSGSTGKPRIVERTAAAVNANVQRVSAGLRVTREDRFLSVVPFWHANGFSNCLLMPLFNGASIVTMDRFLPRPMLDLVQQKRPTVVIGSPFIFHALAQVIQPDSDLGHVRAWISSGATLTEELVEKLRHLHIRVRQLYGSSETGTISISTDDATRAENVGKPLPGVQVRIVDGANHELQPGQPGDVQVASTSLFSGYVGESNDAVPITEDGFYCMNDRGVRDPAGNLSLLGRSDTMINISGVKVDPEEIQRVLASMPGIEQSLVFGFQDVNGVEMIKSMLVVQGEISTEDVLDHCRKRLAEHKLPRTIEFVEKIPRDLMGKSARSILEK